MKITVSGHHVKITKSIQQAIETKFAKLAKHFPDLMQLDSVITVEPNAQKLEVSTQYEGRKVSVKASGKQLYAAIAQAAKKLEAALKHRKGVMSKKLHKKYQVKQVELISPV